MKAKTRRMCSFFPANKAIVPHFRTLRRSGSPGAAKATVATHCRVRAEAEKPKQMRAQASATENIPFGGLAVAATESRSLGGMHIFLSPRHARGHAHWAEMHHYEDLLIRTQFCEVRCSNTAPLILQSDKQCRHFELFAVSESPTKKTGSVGSADHPHAEGNRSHPDNVIVRLETGHPSLVLSGALSTRTRTRPHEEKRLRCVSKSAPHQTSY